MRLLIVGVLREGDRGEEEKRAVVVVYLTIGCTIERWKGAYDVSARSDVRALYVRLFQKNYIINTI